MCADGLELATKLGNQLGKQKRANITLIDASPSHLWKPLLYEVAAGSLDSYAERLEYLAQGHWNHFRFRLGRMDALDRTQKTVSVAPTLDEGGIEIIPRRHFHYDTLVISVGSIANDFGIPGVAEHCILITLGQSSTVGNLMSSFSGGIIIESLLARFMYWSLHKMHQIALHGWVKTLLSTYAHLISSPTRARVKLH